MDEKLLHDVARIARQEEEAEQRFEEPWRRFTAGETSAEEEEALRAAAATSDAARDDYEAFRPLGEAFEAKMAREWQAHTRQRDEDDGQGNGADVVPLRPARPRRRFQPWMALAAVLAVAVIGLFLLRSPLLRSPLLRSPLPPLPAYEVSLEGDLSTTRSPDAGSEDLPTFLLGGTFRLVLTPPEILDEEPRFAFYLAAEDGALEPWPVDRAISADGAVKIEGVFGEDLDVAPGRHTLAVVYGLPGRLPEPQRLEDLATPEVGVWGVLRIPFRVAAGTSASGELPLEVEWAGCYAVYPGPVCVPYPEITLWARSAPEARLEVYIGGRLREPPQTSVDGGQRFELEVSPADGVIEVTATRAGWEPRRFRLTLVGGREPPWLHEAGRLAANDAAAARQSVETRLAAANGEERGTALSLLARLAPNSEKRTAWLEEAAALHREHGRLLALAQDLAALSHADLGARRFALLRQRLDDLETALGPDPPAEARFRHEYYRGILARDLGDHRGALAHLDAAATLARRLDMGLERASAENATGLLLASLGRSHEAATRFQDIDLAALPVCERARTLNNHAWISILDATAIKDGPPAPLADPLSLLAAALELTRNAPCGAGLELDLLLDRALALVLREHVFEAHQALEHAARLDFEPSALHRLWRHDVEGRLALLDGRGQDALEHYRRMEDLAASAFDPGGAWWAKIGQARAHQAQGNASAALVDFAAAERLIDEQSLRVPLDAGRESFVAQREEGTRRHLELLLAEGRVAEALSVARRSRARVLRMLQHGHRLARLDAQEQARWDLEIGRFLELRTELERQAADDWRLAGSRREGSRERRGELREQARQSLDRAFQVLGGPPNAELPALRDGELTLVHHPLIDGWIAFAATPVKIRVHRFAIDDAVLERPGELSGLLLEPFRAEIEAAQKIRVLSWGATRGIDFHALPFDGHALIAHRPVVYGLDLGRPETAMPKIERAVLVADPRGDLPAARHEAAVAGNELRATALEVQQLEGPRAVAAAVRRAVPQANLFHYSGHGVAAGRFGFESALLLAAGTALGPGDVLTLENAPAVVVLSACESARGADTAVESLGLAQAFLVAGSQRVIAASRPVGDRETAELFRRFYSSWDGLEDVASAFSRAQLDWHETDPAADWASFRVLEP